MVSKRHKITNVPLFKKIWDIIFFLGDYYFYLVPQKKYVPHFLKKRDINSYNQSTVLVLLTGFFLYILQSNQVEFTLPAVKNVCRTDVAAIFVVLTPVNDKQHRVQQVLYFPAVQYLVKGAVLHKLSTLVIVYDHDCTVLQVLYCIEPDGV